MSTRETCVVPAGSSIFESLMIAEWQAFGQLGPVLGSFLDLTGTASEIQLRIPVKPPRNWDPILAEPGGRIAEIDVSRP